MATAKKPVSCGQRLTRNRWVEEKKGHRRDMEALLRMTDPEFKLELYKSYVATITATESRRQQASTVYLGMIAAVATFASSISNISLILKVEIDIRELV